MWSGDRKPTLPPMSQVCVRPANPASSRKFLARPKSDNFTTGAASVPVTSKLEGLMSRWTYPLPWAWSRAISNWTPMDAPAAIEIGGFVRRPIHSRAFLPGTYSMIIWNWPSSSRIS